MKLQDLFKMIEKENELNELMGSIERNVIKLDEIGDMRYQSFKTFKEFKKAFNAEYIVKIENDTQIFNNKGYINFTAKGQQKNWSREKGVYWEDTESTFNIYIDKIQEWN